MTPKASGDLVPSCLPSLAVGLSSLLTLQANNTGLYSAAGPWQNQTLPDSRNSPRPRYLPGNALPPASGPGGCLPTKQAPAQSHFVRAAFFKPFHSPKHRLWPTLIVIAFPELLTVTPYILDS